MTFNRLNILLFLLGAWLLAIQPAHATFSIAACDADTGHCGVAVATHNLAVGHGVPFAISKVGAGVSQFETNACHAPVILNALKAGATAKTALNAALNSESDCLDGMDTSFRQIGIASFTGPAAAYTGSEAQGYAGHRADGFVSVQGNGLTSKIVLDKMWDRFHSANGSLAERLLTALEAGHKAGGQSIGVMSASLIVATPAGWPIDIDMRVDFAPSTAIADIREIFNANYARQLLFRAKKLPDKTTSKELIEEALRRAPTWDRIWLQAADHASKNGDRELALKRACHFQTLNPVWAKKLSGRFEFTQCK